MKVDAENVIKRLTAAGIISTVSLSILMQDFSTVFMVMSWYMCTLWIQEEIIETYRNRKAKKKGKDKRTTEKAA